MDSATRYGSCVPVTTIGIPIFAPETNGRRIRRLIANAVGNVCGAPLKTDVGRHSPDDLVQAFRMLLGHFAGKMGCDLQSSRFGGWHSRNSIQRSEHWPEVISKLLRRADAKGLAQRW